ncbi:MAG: peptidoglycan DD-metalloendopeptidase family protein [Nocardioidaceae bacterium]
MASVVTGSAGTAAHASNADPDFEAPFACGQQWSASTRDGHSPSYYAVDFNRDGDEGSPALASAPGQVTTVENLGDTSYGRYIVVDHGNGWSTLYAHLDTQWVVPGQWVDQGDYVGLVGGTGNITGPHLHFEERLNGTDQWAYFHRTQLTYNTTITSQDCGDVPVVGDWNGDRTSDVGIFRRNATSAFWRRLPDGTGEKVTMGAPTDVPLTGDWNGDGNSDVGVWSRPTKTFTLRSSSGDLTTFAFGKVKDIPITGDWNGDGTTDVGTFRPVTGAFRLRAADGQVTRYRFGSASSVPVTGDWNGDGRTDIGVYDPATHVWSLRAESGAVRTVTFGGAGAMPVTGDWNGDGTTNLGTWHPRTADFSLRRPGGRVSTITFGHHR